MGSCLVVLRLSGTARVTNAFNQFLNLNGRLFSCIGYNEGYRKVDDGTNCTAGQRGDTQHPVFRGVRQVVGAWNEQPTLVHKDVRQGEAQTGQHTSDGASVVNTL